MPHPNASGRPRTLESLVELVAALDRRVPHAERSAEERIAEDSSELRAEASLRIDELRAAATACAAADGMVSGSVMSDANVPASGKG